MVMGEDNEHFEPTEYRTKKTTTLLLEVQDTKFIFDIRRKVIMQLLKEKHAKP